MDCSAENISFFGDNLELAKSLGKISKLLHCRENNLGGAANGLVDDITFYVPLDELIDVKWKRCD